MDMGFINTVCKEIIGFKFYRITRASDMLCLEIGNEIEYKSSCKCGQHRLIGQYTFHIQCPWRINNEKLMLGSRDIYTPGSKIDYEEFNWEIVGSSRFDEKVYELNNKWKGTLVVKNIKVSKLGDIKITFENGIVFETFIATSDKDEEWRLINYKTLKHYVVIDDVD